MDIVYDSYIGSSLKEGERKRRTDCEPLELVNLSLDTKIPVQIDRFWASPMNKNALQMVSRDFFIQIAVEEKLTVVLSGYVGNSSEEIKCKEYRPDGEFVTRDELTSCLEEADIRLIPHVYHAIINGHTKIIVISNDTDVFVLLLFYMAQYYTNGLKELWLKFGVGSNTRFLPIHVFWEKLGNDF